MSFFSSNTRCPSLFHTLQGERVPCFASANHEMKHCGQTASGIMIRWTDEDAIEARRAGRTKIIGPIEVWRAWKLHSETATTHDPNTLRVVQYSLQSSYVNLVWDSPVMRTKGNKEVKWENDKKPTDTHDCGVYCYKTPNLLLNHTMEFINYPAFGRCHIKGHAVEHEFGYRAQELMIQEIWIVKTVLGSDYYNEIQKDLESLYQCTVNQLDRAQLQHWANFYSLSQEEREK